ncbi:MAG: hypothetical protein GY765_36760 [bacterium]|nr:hypothetical protein [bacterium]
MTTKEAYQAKIDELNAIPDSKAFAPNIPVSVCIQEAIELHGWCGGDREQLEALGLSWELVEDIPIRAKALREAQSICRTASDRPKEGVITWETESVKAKALRTELLHKYRFAFRDHPQLPSRLKSICKGRKQSDLVQSLSDLSYMGREHPQLLAAVNIDSALVEEAAGFAAQLGRLLTQAKKRKAQIRHLKIFRNKAYYHLKEAVDKLRSAGQHIFHGDPERFEGYGSDYLRVRRKKTASNKSKKSKKDSDVAPNTRAVVVPVVVSE